jgi:hypothetical protein
MSASSDEQVPVSPYPEHQFGTHREQTHVIIKSTDGYAVDWTALFEFHRQRSRDASVPLSRRRWHSYQAKLVAEGHLRPKSLGFNWMSFCAASRQD